ncbi:MAG: zinc-dependent peptidase [Burkholderiales bacterium]
MGWLRDWKRRRILARHRIDERLWEGVVRELPFLAGLDEAGMRRLRELALLFLAEKEFSAARGLRLTSAMRLSIAAQAVLPVLVLGLDWYAGWKGIVVYPGDFRVRRREMDDDGVVHEWDDALAGEAWPGGPVVLSWDTLKNAPDMNVVIHEFAHKLDMLNGEADGLPPLHADMDRKAWSAAWSAAYAGFCDAVDRGRQTWLDPYASENAAEFFAVMSEAFFLDPQEARRRYPEVYEQLTRFYRQDPAARMPA